MNTPEFTDIDKKFAVRYYKWAQLEYINLVKSSCADLESFKSGNGWRFRSFMLTLTEGERFLLGEAVLSRFHPVACCILHFAPSSESLELDRRRRIFRASTFSEIEEHPERFAKELFVSKRLLKNTIMAEFKSAFGKNSYRISVNSGSRYLEYETPCDDFFIRTWFDFGSLERGLGYGHGVFKFSGLDELPVNRPILGSSRFSLLSWLGISSETNWSYITHQECAKTCCTVMEVCGRFMSAAPGLLQNIYQ